MEHNIVNVRFVENHGGRLYRFKNHISNLRKGDYVVVDAKGNMEIAMVHETNVLDETATKWIIDRIDFTMYELSKEGERKAKSYIEF